MRKSYLVALLYSLLMIFFPLITFCQTTTDTATILTGNTSKKGTVTRGLPKVEPVKPEPLGSSGPLPIVSTPQEPVAVESAISRVPTSPSIVPFRKAARIRPKPHLPTIIPSSSGSDDVQDTLLFNAYQQSVLAYYRSVERRNIANTTTFDSVTSYYAWALKNRQNIITRQQTTGSMIFILVISVVLIGLVFSAIQFYIAVKSVNLKGSFTDTSVKASLSGVEVSSSVLGVIILTLSIVFFYLYLTNVYPLVSLDQIPVQSAMKAETAPVSVAE